jgi:hypothetical protein
MQNLEIGKKGRSKKFFDRRIPPEKISFLNNISAVYVAEICPHICLDAHIFIGPF